LSAYDPFVDTETQRALMSAENEVGLSAYDPFVDTETA